MVVAPLPKLWLCACYKLCDGMLWVSPRLTGTGAWNIAAGRGKGLCGTQGLNNCCSSGSFYLCPQLWEVNLALRFPLASVGLSAQCLSWELPSEGCWAKPAAAKCAPSCLGGKGLVLCLLELLWVLLLLHMLETWGFFFSFSEYLEKKPPMNLGSLEPVGKACPAVFVTR